MLVIIDAVVAKWITCCYDDPTLPTHMPGRIQHPLPVPQAPPIYNVNASGHARMINKEWKGTYPDLSSVETSFYNTDNHGDKSKMTMRQHKRRKEERMLIEMAKQKQGQISNTVRMET